MRLLILSQYYAPEVGAPQTRLRAIAKELVRAGHQVEVVTGMPNYPTGRTKNGYRSKWSMRDEVDGVTVYRTWLLAASGGGLKRMLNYASFTATSVTGLLRARRPDYIFVESPPLFLSLTANLMARYWKAQVIFNVADLWPDSIRQMGILREGPLLRGAEKLEVWTYRTSTYVNAVTDGIATTLIGQKGVPREKVLLLPNGVDLEQFRPTPPDARLIAELGLAGKCVILCAGTVGFAQGLDVALESMQRLRESDPNVILLLLGDGSDRARLQKLAADKRLLNVRFLDPVDLSTVNRMYSVAWAGLATLRDLPIFDGVRPSKILPAMAAGKPVLFSGGGEGASLVQQAGAGVVTPPEDAAALAEAIRRISRDAEYADRLGRHGRLYMEQHLSWEAVVSRWLAQLTPAAEEAHAVPVVC